MELFSAAGGTTFRRCTFTGNFAYTGGGGIKMLDAVTVDRCSFENNQSSNGGAIYTHDTASATPRITRSQFIGNWAWQNGGAVYLDGPYAAEISDCVFRNNTARVGGAPKGKGPVLDVINCIFDGNEATHEWNYGGGAIYNDGSGGSTLVNCLLKNNHAVNQGGAIWNLGDSSLTMVNCTMVNNESEEEGGGIFSQESATVTMVGSVAWGNTAAGVMLEDESQIFGPAGVTYSCIMDQQPGGGHIPFGGTANGNIDLDPQFVNPGNGNYRLQGGSPANDNGNNNPLIPLGINTDLDRADRTMEDDDVVNCAYHPDGESCGVDPIVDMGAFEFNACGLCPTDVDHNGRTEAFDLAFLLGFWGPVNPATECLDADNDGQIGPFDLAFLLGFWGTCCGDNLCIGGEDCASCSDDCGYCP